MSLAAEVLAELRSHSGNPTFCHLTDEMIALCAVLDRREQIAAQNRHAAGTDLKSVKQLATPRRQ